jgi:hypothetical protein
MHDITTYTRNKTSDNFEGSTLVDYPPKTRYFSPDKKYCFDMTVFSKPIDNGVTFGNYFFAKIEIFDHESQGMIFEALNNHSQDAHQWLEIDGKTYLFFAEFQQGMSVYNLTDKTQNSYLAEKSHAQIIQYFPSPDALKIATVEYALQNLEILVYDISKPMELPYPVVFKKIIENSNGKQVKTVDWHGDSINIIHEEYVQVCSTSIKVQVVGVTDDYFMGKCRFEDIHGKEYFGYEKWQAMFGFMADENTVFPLESGLTVQVVKVFTKNNQKIATISVEIGYITSETITIDVHENQLSTYWYHQNYIL